MLYALPDSVRDLVAGFTHRDVARRLRIMCIMESVAREPFVSTHMWRDDVLAACKEIHPNVTWEKMLQLSDERRAIIALAPATATVPTDRHLTTLLETIARDDMNAFVRALRSCPRALIVHEWMPESFGRPGNEHFEPSELCLMDIDARPVRYAAIMPHISMKRDDDIHSPWCCFPDPNTDPVFICNLVQFIYFVVYGKSYNGKDVPCSLPSKVLAHVGQHVIMEGEFCLYSRETGAVAS